MSPMVRQPLTVEHALLGFLRQGPNHGYGIYQTLADPADLGLVWQLKQSQLYALLNKLEEEAYVTATVEPQDSRPPRKIYTLTDAGREAFAVWLKTPVEHGRHLRLEFLAKLYFARQEDNGVVEQLVEAQRAVCGQWLEAQKARSEVARSRPYAWLVHQFRIGQIEAMIAWLDECNRVAEEQ